MPGLGGQAKAWLRHKVPGGSCVLPFAHTASFSAHSPSCLLQASLAGASENFPELGYQPGLLKVTSLPPAEGSAGPSQSPSLTTGDYHITARRMPGCLAGAWHPLHDCLGWGVTRTAPHCPALHPRESIGPALCLSSLSARPGWGSRAPGPHHSHEHGSLMPPPPPPPGLGDMHRTLGWIGSTHTHPTFG